jgi:hypothetical protein
MSSIAMGSERERLSGQCVRWHPGVAGLLSRIRLGFVDGAVWSQHGIVQRPSWSAPPDPHPHPRPGLGRVPANMAMLAVPIVPQASGLPGLSRGEASGQSAAWDLRKYSDHGRPTPQLTSAQIPTPLYINAPFLYIFSPCHSSTIPPPLCHPFIVVANAPDRHHGR